jgi:hypothetical protein
MPEAIRYSATVSTSVLKESPALVSDSSIISEVAIHKRKIEMRIKACSVFKVSHLI